MPATPLELNPTVELVCTDIVNESNVYLRPQELVTITTPTSVDELIEKKIGSQMVHSCSKDGFVLSSADSVRGQGKSTRALYKPLRILTRSAGDIPAEHLNGSFVYRVCYSHYVCNPPLYVVIPAVVCEKNKLGIRCHYYPYTYDTATNEVATGDVMRARAHFVAIFLPKALHCNLQMMHNEDDGTEDGANAVGNIGSTGATANDVGDVGDVGEDRTQMTPKELYESEEARIDANEANDTINSYNDRSGGGATQVIVHVKILQKRFDINDKQISAVGVLERKGYSLMS